MRAWWAEAASVDVAPWPTQLHLDASLGLVLGDGQPLKIPQLIFAPADEGFPVVHLKTRAGPSRLPGARAGVQALKLCAQGGGARGGFNG